MKKSTKEAIRSEINGFKNELLLYSGQYALFYIIMNFSRDGFYYFNDSGHTILLLVLFFQTVFLVHYGTNAWFRFMGSLIAPLFYTIIEYNLDYQFLFNTAHIFFWIFSIMVGLAQSIQINIVNIIAKKINEYIITFLNVVIFLFIYFYFDLSVSLKEQLLKQIISLDEYTEGLKVFSLPKNLVKFFEDPTHIFIVVGGILLAISIAVGRIKIIELNEEVKRLFGRYVDNKIRDRIITEGTGKSEKKELCVLFSDIRSFTSLSETHAPQEITQMLNKYFTQWANLSEKYFGIIDKYIGDAVMIVFGNPDKEKAVANAVSCALEMLEKLKEIKINLRENGLPVFKDIGIGLHYGAVIAGDIGSRDRVNYTYIGDTVNIASRLEGISKEIDGHLVISQTVYMAMSSELKSKFVEYDKDIFLKGKSHSVKIFYYKETE